MKYSLLSIICLLSGYFIYPVLHPAPVAPTITEEKKNKFKNFMNNEAKEFAQLQDADAKLKAAEAMYGKIMMLFLAELGLRTQYELRPVSAKLPESEPDHVLEASESNPVTLPASSPVVSTATQKPEEKKVMTKDQENWVKYTTTPFLESFNGKNRRLLGRFEGSLTHETKPHTGRVDAVVMQFNLFQRGGKEIDGDTSVSMVDPEGKEYSRNNGSGGNRAIKGLPDKENAYFVEASPTSYFLINLTNFPQVNGQYFEKGKFVGNVHLRKLNR